MSAIDPLASKNKKEKKETVRKKTLLKWCCSLYVQSVWPVD